MEGNSKLEIIRMLLKGLKKEAMSLEGNGLKKAYGKCEHCGAEGCTENHEMDKAEGLPEVEGETEVAVIAEPEKEIDLESLLSEMDS